MSREKKIKVVMTEGEANALKQLLNTLRDKFTFGTGDRFFLNTEGSTVSLEFDGYARICNVADRLGKGGAK